MLVYVQNKYGQPLMPTSRCGKVRRLLKSGQAKGVSRCPFVIRLLYDTTDVVQEVTLGVDAGSKVIGLSACTEEKELYAAEVQLRTDIVKNLSVRRECRRARRNRKRRYRKSRFQNRMKSKNKGWLAPAVEAKIGTHLKVVENVTKLLPISKIVVEVASFDIQKIKAIKAGELLPRGTDYQKGEQLGFWNVREYVLFRDGHVCQSCKCKSGDKVLEVHHIESRQTGGDAPNNLVTLCDYCHTHHYGGGIKLPAHIKRGASYRDAAFMGIMRWAFYDRLKALYPSVSLTYGYITKTARINCKLEKTHAVDARCISGHPLAEPLGYYYAQKKVRCHNRQLHKMTIAKGGVRKANQAAKEVKGFRLFDVVLFDKQECFVFGRRTNGGFNLRHLDGTVVHTDAPVKSIKPIKHSNTVLTERRQAASSPWLKPGVPAAKI